MKRAPIHPPPAWLSLTVLLALAAPTVARSAEAPARPEAAAGSATPVEVRVERVKPMRDKHPTLRFLRENRDFIRARFDRLREKPLERKGETTAIDPRFLAYAQMLAALDAGRDSLLASEEARSRRLLFESVGQLAELEAQLDQMELQLDVQRGRLAVLERDFTGDQKTELMVVLTGLPEAALVSAVTLELEDGGVLSLPLSDPQRESLRQGGMVEIFHGFVEPRAQVVRVGVAGASWPSGDSGYMKLEPARDRLNLLRLDLSTLSPEPGAPGIGASTWVHTTSSLSIDG